MGEENTQIVTINGKTVDLSSAIPIRVGDMRQLQKLGVDLSEFQRVAEEKGIPDMEQTANLLLHFTSKCNDKITIEDIDSIEIDEMAVVINMIFNKSKEADPDPNI